MPETLIHRESKKVHNVPEIKMKHEPSYVDNYFKSNGNTKPLQTIRIFDLKLDQARSVVHDQFINNRLQPMIATTYLYRWAETLKVKVEGDWKSYGVTIANDGDTITPLDLVDFKASPEPTEMSQGAAKVTSADDSWLIIAVTSHYRLALCPDQVTYINELVGKIVNLMNSAGYTGNARPKRSLAFTTNSSFSSIIAVLDMFWSKFPDLSSSSAQIGTLVSRYQDCTILGSINSVSKLLGLSPSLLFQWIFNRNAGTEALTIISSPDEMNVLDSYFPYLHGLKLTQRSPYSASTCPNLHLFMHLLGCTTNSKRSVDARLVDGANVSEMPRASLLVGYALKQSTDMTPQYLRTSEQEKLLDDESEDDPLALGAEPRTRDPLAWYSWFSGNGFTYSKKMVEFIEKTQKAIQNPRKGSIGEAYKNYVP